MITGAVKKARMRGRFRMVCSFFFLRGRVREGESTGDFSYLYTVRAVEEEDRDVVEVVYSLILYM